MKTKSNVNEESTVAWRDSIWSTCKRLATQPHNKWLTRLLYLARNALVYVPKCWMCGRVSRCVVVFCWTDVAPGLFIYLFFHFHAPAFARAPSVWRRSVSTPRTMEMDSRYCPSALKKPFHETLDGVWRLPILNAQLGSIHFTCDCVF